MPNRLQRSGMGGALPCASRSAIRTTRYEEHQRHEEGVIEPDDTCEERRMRMRVHERERSPQHRIWAAARSYGEFQDYFDYRRPPRKPSARGELFASLRAMSKSCSLSSSSRRGPTTLQERLRRTDRSVELYMICFVTRSAHFRSRRCAICTRRKTPTSHSC
jgi:hypothetical protein